MPISVCFAGQLREKCGFKIDSVDAFIYQTLERSSEQSPHIETVDLEISGFFHVCFQKL